MNNHFWRFIMENMYEKVFKKSKKFENKANFNFKTLLHTCQYEIFPIKNFSK